MFKRFLALLLTAIILFAEAGQVVYAHTCFKSNETSFSLYSPAHCKDDVVEKSCCAKKQQEKSEECLKGKESCCGVSAKYVQQSFPTHETELKKPTIAKDVMLPVTFRVAISNSIPLSVASAVIPSPSLIGQHSSSFLCIYRC